MSDSDKKQDSFAALFEAEKPQARPARAPRIGLGDRCRAEVIQVGKDDVFVELLDRAGDGPRQQAYIRTLDLRAPDGTLTCKPGDVIEAVVVENKGGEVRLGRGLDRPAGLDEIANAHAAGVPVEGKIAGVNKGGLEVDIGGLRAFCPISQADRGFVADSTTLVGKSSLFLVTELREGGKRIVVSRRAVHEQEAKLAAAQTLARLVPGATARGSVTSVREFGAFVDLGGLEGLIPNAELSHDRGQKAADVLKPGDVVDVLVREIKEGVDKRGAPVPKITLSLKALAADPWDVIDTTVQAGKVAAGSVTRLAEFGAFVKLAPGIEGLLHISELGGKVGHPSQLLKVGQTVQVVVRSVDKESRRISLEPAPDGLAIGTQVGSPTLVVGAIVNGTVDRVETYGVFMQVEGTRGRAGRGLIPNAELGTARGADTRKLFPAGHKLTAKVLETGDGKLRLSIKAIAADEERADFDGYRETSRQQAKLGTFADLLKKR